MRGHKKWQFLLAALMLLILPVPAFAQSSSSSANYRVDQTFFGSGGELNACSSSYCSKQTAGELTVGNVCSASYCAQAGFNTTDDPFLEFVVTNDNIDLGYLDPTSVKTATGTFNVRAWNSGGYVVRTVSDPPTNAQGGHQLAPLTSGGSSTPGTEQFGINVVKNTNFCGAGCDLGADPAQVPNSSFSFGTAATGYDTSNTFRYNKNDVIAQSTKSTSITAYTVSYIFNIDTATASGQYTFNHVLVATATY
jgi:hypothetical protein